MPSWLHTTLTVLAGAASVAAGAFIPPTLMLIPAAHLSVVAAVQMALVAGAAVGIDGSKVASTIAGVLNAGKAPK